MHTLFVKDFGFNIFFSGKSHLKKAPLQLFPSAMGSSSV